MENLKRLEKMLEQLEADKKEVLVFLEENKNKFFKTREEAQIVEGYYVSLLKLNVAISDSKLFFFNLQMKERMKNSETVTSTINSMIQGVDLKSVNLMPLLKNQKEVSDILDEMLQKK